MIAAVNSGKREVVELLVENIVRINGVNSNYRPLYQAVSKRYQEIANLLIEKGIDVNERDVNVPCETALHMAVDTDEVITKILLRAGADFEAKDDNGRTPLDLSSNRSYSLHITGKIYNEATTKLLLEAGASIENCKSYKYPEWVETITKFASTCTLPPPQPSQVNDNTTGSQELQQTENSVVLGMRDGN